MIRIREGSAPDFKNKSWTMAAEIAIPDSDASGVVATIGGRFGDWALLLQDGKPEFAYALSNQPQHKFRIASDRALTPGNHVVRVKFAEDGGGIGKGATGTLRADEKEVAQGKIPRTIGVRLSLDETFDVGEDAGIPVIERYADKMPYAFTGALERLAVVLAPEKLTDEEQQRLHEELSRALMTVQRASGVAGSPARHALTRILYAYLCIVGVCWAVITMAGEEARCSKGCQKERGAGRPRSWIIRGTASCGGKRAES